MLISAAVAFFVVTAWMMTRDSWRAFRSAWNPPNEPAPKEGEWGWVRPKERHATIPVDAPVLDIESCVDETERRFIVALHKRAVDGDWFAAKSVDFWQTECEVAHLVIVLDIEGANRPGISSTYRIEYARGVLLIGRDQTGQLVTPIDFAHPESVVKSDGTPEEQAEFAADWVDALIVRLGGPSKRYSN